jgi:histidine triad (HIT) family protein
MGEDCAFCQIVAGTLPSSLVHESATVLVVMDVDPVTPGHLLVISKAHLPALADLSDALAREMFSVARTMASALRRTSLRCEGVNIFYADGEAAFQEVFHSHLHVFPRFRSDGFVITANWGTAPDRSELDAIASQIRDAVV